MVTMEQERDRLVSFANPEVLAFYRTLPFNFRESVAKSIEAIRSHDPRLAYPVLTSLLRPGVRVLDVGCGAGWFANSISYHCGCAVSGIRLFSRPMRTIGPGADCAVG